VAVFFFLPLRRVLEIRNYRSQELLGRMDLGFSENFKLSYTHSVNKGRVVDFFQILPDGSLLLGKSLFQSFGAGMEDGESGPGRLSMTDEGLLLEDINLGMPSLVVAVGSVADHRLGIPGKREMPLTAFSEPLRFVSIRFERIPLFTWGESKPYRENEMKREDKHGYRKHQS
jgi:hypothetical protein